VVKALFDTNILIDYLNGVPQARAGLQRFEARAISIITWLEVMVHAEWEVESTLRGFSRWFTSSRRSQSAPSRCVELTD
jgi:predicted nucleic acid-binding protein